MGGVLKWWADGLPLFHGAQLAIDNTLVSPLSRDGLPHPRCVREDGAALAAARRRKERTYPKLTGQFGRARLVVLAGEVGGRWSDETQAFLRQLAKARARSETGAPASPCKGSVAHEMEGDLGLQQCQGVRDVVAGSEGRWWVRWSHSDHCRRCWGVSATSGPLHDGAL